MDEFITDMFNEQRKIVEATLEIVKLNEDKYSEKAIANFSVLIKDISTLTCSLMTAVSSGKIHKVPRKYNAWKKKKDLAGATMATTVAGATAATQQLNVENVEFQ